MVMTILEIMQQSIVTSSAVHAWTSATLVPLMFHLVASTNLRTRARLKSLIHRAQASLFLAVNRLVSQ